MQQSIGFLHVHDALAAYLKNMHLVEVNVISPRLYVILRYESPTHHFFAHMAAPGVEPYFIAAPVFADLLSELLTISPGLLYAMQAYCERRCINPPIVPALPVPMASQFQ